MSIKVIEIEQEKLDSIFTMASKTAQKLLLDSLNGDAVEIVNIINSLVIDLVFERNAPFLDLEEAVLELGSLWGVQLQKQFGWQWVELFSNDEHCGTALVSPNCSMFISPFNYLISCLSKQCVCTVQLSFTMIANDAAIQDLPEYEYLDIMDRIVHVIPPYSLEINEGE